MSAEPISEAVGLTHVPDLPPDADTLTTALAWADAGGYVGPLRAGTKNPGSVIGDEQGRNWQTRTSRDPETIAAWFAGTDHGLFLHCGRSGVLAVDVDRPDNLPAVLADHIGTTPYQATQPTQPGRGHHLFAIPSGVMYGNGLGQLPKGWGELRGRNGVIVLAPTPHPDGGHYEWQRTGAVPVLPDAIAELLPDHDGSDAADAATDAEVQAFLTTHCDAVAEGDALLAVVLDKATATVAASGSRHDTLVTHLAWAMDDAAAGLYPAAQAFHRFAQWFADLYDHPATPRRPRPPKGQPRTQPDVGEYLGAVAWAVGQASAKGDDEREQRRARATGSLTGTGMPESVWQERPLLAHIRRAAYARGVSAPALLAAFLARFCAEIDPRHVLPPIIGGHVSLNLYVALLGASGAGKSSTLAVADELAAWGTRVAGIASGEGLLRGYGTYDKSEGRWVQTSSATAVQVDEVRSLTAQNDRAGATLIGLINSAWTGTRLSQPYADVTKRAELPAHAYRLSVVVGVQVGRAQDLLGHSDSGTPQRFLWAPLVDPAIPRRGQRPAWPGRLELPRPRTGQGTGLAPLGVPDSVADAIADEHHTVVTQWSAPGEDGHGRHDNLQRLKVAGLLALLDDRHDITEDDWRIAGLLHEASQAALAHARADQRFRDEAAAKAAGVRQARVAAVASAIAEDTGPQRFAQRLARHVHAHGRDGGCVKKCAKGRAGQGGLLGYWDEAVARAVAAGWVTVDDRPHPKKSGATVVYLLPGPVKP